MATPMTVIGDTRDVEDTSSRGSSDPMGTLGNDDDIGIEGSRVINGSRHHPWQ